MYVRDTITGFLGSAGDYYIGAAGQLPGSSEMVVSALVWITDRIDAVLFGTLQLGPNTGWALSLHSDGTVSGAYGDGVSVIQVATPAPVELGHWALLVLVVDVAGGTLELYVNGTLAAFTPTAGALVPSGLPPSVGGSTAVLLAGCAYGSGFVSNSTNVLAYWESVSRTGQTGQTVSVLLGSIPFTNVWQMALYNDAGLAVWAPAVGTLPLTRVGNTGLVINTPNVWASVSGGGGGGGGGGAQAFVVWRPGVPSSLNVVETWAEVEARIAATQGNIVVQVDSSIAPAVVPATANTECFGRVQLVGYTLNIAGLMTVSIADGGRLRNLTTVKSMVLNCVTTIHEALLQNIAGGVLICREGGQINMALGSTVPAIRYSATFSEVLSFEGATFNNNAGNPLLAMIAVDPGLTCTHAIISQAGSQAFSGADAYSPQLFAGDATTTLLEILDSSAPQVTQTWFLGTVNAVPMSTARGTSYDDTLVAPPLGAANVQDAIDELKASGGTLIFRPGEPSPAGNVYASWTLLYTAFQATQGPQTIVFDDSLASCLIPAGAYDMSRTAWVAAHTSASPITISFAPGVTLTQLPASIGFWLIVGCSGDATAVCTLTSGVHNLTLYGSSIRQSANTGPFIRADGPSELYLFVEEVDGVGGVRNDGAGLTHPAIVLGVNAYAEFYFNGVYSGVRGTGAIRLAGAGAYLDFGFLGAYAQLDAGSLTSIVGTTYDCFVLADAFQNVSHTQPGALGTINFTLDTLADGIRYTPATPANWVAPRPANVANALNRLAAAVAGLLGGPIP